MQIINIDIKELRPYEKNAKKHDKTQIDNVAESIKQFGMVQPIVVDKDKVVIIGHCRLEACKKLKMKEVPCVMVEDLTEEQLKWNKMWELWTEAKVEVPYAQLMTYQSEINNGGHGQYFCNVENNDDLSKEISALKLKLKTENKTAATS